MILHGNAQHKLTSIKIVFFKNSIVFFPCFFVRPMFEMFLLFHPVQRTQSNEKVQIIFFISMKTKKNKAKPDRQNDFNFCVNSYNSIGAAQRVHTFSLADATNINASLAAIHSMLLLIYFFCFSGK